MLRLTKSMVACVVMLLVLTACPARHIREAQDHFSRAATAENRALVEGYSTDGANLSADPAVDYRLSLSLVEAELAKNEGKLRDDKLYGTALMLRAMCLWRLADLEAVNAKTPTAKEVIAARDKKPRGDSKNDATNEDAMWATLRRLEAEDSAKTVSLGQRDKAMLKALPGLRDHDRGLATADYVTAAKFFESAHDVLEATLKDTERVPPGHPVAVYLRLAMLSTCRAWHAAAFRANDKDARKEIKKKAIAILEQLKKRDEHDVAVWKAATLFRTRLGIGATGNNGFVWDKP